MGPATHVNLVAPLLLLIALVRGALWILKHSRAEGVHDTTRAKAPAADGVFGAWIAALAVVSFLVLALTAGLGAIVMLPVWALAVEPWFLGGWAVFRGYPRVAYAGARFSTLTWRTDRRGGAAFASAWASVRSGQDVEPWIESPPGREPVTAGLVCAAALAAGAQGARLDATRLLRASTWFDARPTPEREVVAEWLAADAAARGDWREVWRLTATDDARPHPRAPSASKLGSGGALPLAGPRSNREPRLAWLRAVAGRLLDEPDAADVLELERLFDRWDQRPGPAPESDPVRASASALLERARRARHRPTPTPDPLPEDPLAGALEAHRRALISAGWIVRATAAWSAVDEDLPAGVRDQVVRELADRYTTLPDRPLLPGHLGFEVRDRVVQRALAHLTLQCRALQARVAEERDLDPLSEVREFASLAAAVDDVIGPAHLRLASVPLGGPPGDAAAELEVRTTFRAVYSPVTDWAADLYNRRKQPYLFRAVTWWLLELARACADAEAVALYQRNLLVSRGWSAGAHRDAQA